MKTHLLRDGTEARQFLVQGLWWQRVLVPTALTVRPILNWAKELLGGGVPIPPLGFLADLGHVALGEDWDQRPTGEPLVVPQLPMNVMRTYEDHVMGKIYADHTFQRASDALRRYEKGREQARGLAYLTAQFRERARFDAVELPVGIVSLLLDLSADDILLEGYESLRQDGPHPLLKPLYESLIHASRGVAEMLGPEDLFDLETKAALEDLGQRLAHRQVLRASTVLEASLPRHRVRPLGQTREVATHLFEEDAYPVGGFTSLSNRGSIESLLHSQLAYMETEKSEHPDLFDTMYLMDELLYYSRDENQFRRRRRTFVLALAPDLVETRFKDAELPYQRVVMLMGLVHVLVKKMIHWLATDALRFEIIFLTRGGGRKIALDHEKALLAKLFREEIALDVVHLDSAPASELVGRCEQWARRSQVRALTVGVEPPELEARNTETLRLTVAEARPILGDSRVKSLHLDGEDASEIWGAALREILARWL